MSKFTTPNLSIAGAPAIDFHFEGDVATAEIAGATLHAERVDDARADVRVCAADGVILADILVRKMPKDESISVSVMNVGSALLWSHYRWQQAQTAEAATTP